MPTGSLNKGELGELYVLLRLVGSGFLKLSDSKEIPLPGLALDIVEVTREEAANRSVSYTIGTYEVSIAVNGILKSTLQCSEFSKAADELLWYVQENSGKRTLAMPEKLGEFLDAAEVLHYKALSSQKSDIWLTTRDPRTGLMMTKVGYSVKAKWAQRPTLFNTGNGSRSIYTIDGLTSDDEANRINHIVDKYGNADVKGRIRYLLDKDYQLVFEGYPVNPKLGIQCFANNCSYIGDSVSEMWRAVVMEHFAYSAFSGGHNSMQDVYDWLVHANPCKIGFRPEDKYAVFIRNFLFAAYCGLTASTYWNGKNDVNGGLVVVRNDGEVVAFTSLDGAEFRDYLYDNCSMDWPSTSRKHGNYGVVYKEDGLYKIALNFQIRF